MPFLPFLPLLVLLPSPFAGAEDDWIFVDGVEERSRNSSASEDCGVRLVAREEEKLKETLIELPHEDGQKHNYFVYLFTK